MTFQLGMAIGALYALFGDATSPDFRNFDVKLRDYLDGGYQVSLESKNKGIPFRFSAEAYYKE